MSSFVLCLLIMWHKLLPFCHYQHEVPSKLYTHVCLTLIILSLYIYLILIGIPKECSSDVFFAYHLVNSDDAISYQEFFNCLKRVCPILKETGETSSTKSFSLL